MKAFAELQKSFNTRQVKYGGYAAFITIALAAGLILLNLVMGGFNLQLDLTADRLFSLSDQTIQVLDHINSPVRIYGLWPPGEENTDITEVLKLYLARNKNLQYQAIDPDTNPGLLAKYDRDNQGLGRGSVIVEGDKGFRVIRPQDIYEISSYQNQHSVTGIAVEYRLTGALIYAGTGETPVIYEINGHEEIPLEGLSLRGMIEQENYSLRPLNLLQSDIPADASAIIINTPRADMAQAEADKILDYLAGGGRLLVLADYRMQNLSTLNTILASYGLAFEYGVVIENDPSRTVGNAYLTVPAMMDHAITWPLQEKQTPVVMPYAMGITETGIKRRTVSITPLLVSSGNSWLRSDRESAAPPPIPSDIAGPVTLAAAVIDPDDAGEGDTQARIAVISSGAMLQPVGSFGRIPANMDFFMNALTWLEDRPEALAVRSKNIYLMPLMLNGLQIIIFAGIFVILIPLAFFISGLAVWLKRRHL